MKYFLSFLVIGAAVVGLAYYLTMNYTKPNESLVTEPDQSMNALKIETLTPGNGPEAKNGDRLTVHYTGWLEDGTKFDSSVDRGTPFTLTLGAHEVIAGWDQGLVSMKVGEKRKLTIPSELGYGATGQGSIPPNATLIFEVELLKIN